MIEKKRKSHSAKFAIDVELLFLPSTNVNSNEQVRMCVYVKCACLCFAFEKASDANNSESRGDNNFGDFEWFSARFFFLESSARPKNPANP